MIEYDNDATLSIMCGEPAAIAFHSRLKPE